MTVDDYIAHRGITASQFAALIGRSKSFVSRIRSGEAAPSLETLQAIQSVTGGLVTPADFRVRKNQTISCATRQHEN